MNNSANVAKLIKERMKSCGISNKQLSENIDNVNVNTIAQLAKGREISYVTFAKIADYLDCSVDYLLGRTDDPNRHSVFTVSGVSISGDNHNGIRAVNTGNLTVSNGPKLNEMEQHLLEAFRALDFSQKIEAVSSLMKLAQKKSPSDDT